MSLLANSNAIESGGYPIQRSLRFRSSASAYLNRTPASAGNRQIWTWSGWVKRGTLGTAQQLFGADSTTGGGAIPRCQLVFTAADQLDFSNNVTGSAWVDLISASVYRDPSAWYHVICAVDTTQATAANRVKLYVNGNQLASFSSSGYPAQNDNTTINFTGPHNIGRYQNLGTQYFDGYLAEVNFIDGQALTPSSFGYTEPLTGVWQPLKYMGTYGTNGFYLPFSDNTSATTLAYDKSGNGNNWTANNISTTAGATYDSMTDVPTLTSATAANYCVLNPLASTIAGAFTLSAGNLNINSTAQPTVLGTFAIPSSKYYFEATVTNGASAVFVGIENDAGSNRTAATSGGIWLNGASSQTGLTSWSNNDIIGVAVDGSANTVQFYRNGSTYGTQVTYTSSVNMYPYYRCGSTTTNAASYNFGQRPFSYTPPTGFVALNTYNLPTPTILKGNKYMDASLWTGNGTSQSITNSGGFQPDLVWNKSRSTTYSNEITDSVRGVNAQLYTNLTDAEYTATNQIQSFNSNGFTVGAGNNVNASTQTYVGWQWQAGKGTTSSNTSGSITSTVSVNATAGFSVVTWTQTSTGGSVGHGLGVAPSMVVVKSRSITGQWSTWHTGLTSGTYYVVLNTTAAQTNDSTIFSSAPSSSVFNLGTQYTSGSTTFVAYCWAQISGFSKFGSYTGNGSADGPFVFTGHRPRYLMVKRTDTTGNWELHDTSRSPYNAASARLWPNLSSAEDTTEARFDILSNGFKCRAGGGDMNASGGTYIYAAFAETPFKFANAR